MVVAYVVSVLFFWNPTRNLLFKLISVPVWLALLFHLATIVGPLRVPLALVIVSLLLISLVSGMRDFYVNATNEGKKSHFAISDSNYIVE